MPELKKNCRYYYLLTLHFDQKFQFLLGIMFSFFFIQSYYFEDRIITMEWRKVLDDLPYYIYIWINPKSADIKKKQFTPFFPIPDLIFDFRFLKLGKTSRFLGKVYVSRISLLISYLAETFAKKGQKSRKSWKFLPVKYYQKEYQGN